MTSPAPQFVSVAEAAAAASQADLECAAPAGIAVGDLLVAVVRGFQAAQPGWTLAETTAQGGMRVFYKVATATEPSTYTFIIVDGSSAQSRMAIVACYRRANPSATLNIDGQASGAGGGARVSPDVTTTVESCLIVRAVAIEDGGITPVPEANLAPSGHTLRATIQSGGTTSHDTIALADKLQEAAGATGAATWNPTNVSASWGAYTGAFTGQRRPTTAMSLVT